MDSIFHIAQNEVRMCNLIQRLRLDALNVRLEIFATFTWLNIERVVGQQLESC